MARSRLRLKPQGQIAVCGLLLQHFTQPALPGVSGFRECWRWDVPGSVALFIHREDRRADLFFGAIFGRGVHVRTASFPSPYDCVKPLEALVRETIRLAVELQGAVQGVADVDPMPPPRDAVLPPLLRAARGRRVAKGARGTA